MAFSKYGGALNLCYVTGKVINKFIERIMSNIEQTLSTIKPDAVERNLQDKIKMNY